ncbi:hypothetical protein DSO57_1021750 [Entomophthora muscae]|uniref:Uncharacterized protein n=1 Tax=Entomophthora muscae TaxID=34485 RepID=A0ACC2S590_9FUNG|nr:hypothetical protein DSO57_1021750 [Entomophthora muscae]
MGICGPSISYPTTGEGTEPGRPSPHGGAPPPAPLFAPLESGPSNCSTAGNQDFPLYYIPW